MTDPSPLDIHYGHFGDPVYDHETFSWHFGRRAAAEPRLRPLGAFQQVLEGTISSNEILTAESRNFHGQNDDSSIHSPELLPALEAIKKESKASADRQRSSFGNSHVTLDAIGHSRSKKVSRTPVVATIAGAYGELIRFTLLSLKEIGRPHSRERTISQPTLERGENCFWHGGGELILQISASIGPDGGNGTFLAVRYSDRILVLQPLLQSTLAASQSYLSRDFLLPASRLSVQTILDLSKQELGQNRILDVTFNPWNENQLATIDEKSRWTVWEFALSARDRGLWMPQVLSSSNAISNEATGAHEPDEPWARILWAYDHRVLILAQRTVIKAIHLLNTNQPLSLVNIVLGHSGDQLLAIERVRDNANFVFVLTTSRLVVIRIAFIDFQSVQKKPQLKASKMLSCVHYRSADDFSLDFEITRVNMDENCTSFIIMIYSHRNSHVSVFTLQFDISNGLWMSVVDPYVLNMSTGLSEAQSGDQAEGPRLPVRGLHFTPLGTGQPSNASRIGPNGDLYTELVDQYASLDIELFQSRVLFDDCSVWEGMLYYSRSAKIATLEVPRVVKAAKPAQIAHRIQSRQFVEDDYTSQFRLDETLRTQECHEEENDAGERLYDRRTLNLQWLIEILNRSLNSISIQPEEHETLVRRVESALSTKDTETSPLLKTLSEVIDPQITAEGFDQAGNLIDSILQKYITNQRSGHDDAESVIETDRGVAVRRAVFSNPDQDLTGETNGLQETFSRLQAFSPQHELLSSRAEQRSDELFRDVATQNYLAGYTIGRSNKNEAVPPAEDINISHLRSFTSISHQPALPAKLTDMLERWIPGQPTESIDWTTATQRILSTDTASEGEATLSASERKKQQKIMEKRKRRMEEMLPQSASMPTDEARRFEDLGVGGSQPLPFRSMTGGTGVGIGSSSQVSASGTQASDMPMVQSQPVRGPHGQREALPKKKPRRKQGF